MKKLLILSMLLVTMLLADGFKGNKGVKPVDNQLYLNECGSCHFAYQPGLLPERSWSKMMQDLSNHFQTDASLEPKDTQTLLAYMRANASDKAMNYKRSSRITNSLRASATPLRITETPYIIRKHNEIKQSVYERKSIGSLANCAACHQSASRGSYSDDYVRIPKN